MLQLTAPKFEESKLRKLGGHTLAIRGKIFETTRKKSQLKILPNKLKKKNLVFQYYFLVAKSKKVVTFSTVVVAILSPDTMHYLSEGCSLVSYLTVSCFFTGREQLNNHMNQTGEISHWFLESFIPLGGGGSR